LAALRPTPPQMLPTRLPTRRQDPVASPCLLPRPSSAQPDRVQLPRLCPARPTQAKLPSSPCAPAPLPAPAHCPADARAQASNPDAARKLDRSRTEPLDAASRSRAAPSVRFALMELNASVSTLPHYLHSSSMNAIHGSHEDRSPFPPPEAPLSPSPPSINWTLSSSLLLPYPSSLPPQAPSLSPTRPHCRWSSSTPSPSLPAPELARGTPRRPCPHHSSIVHHPWSLTGIRAPPSKRIVGVTPSVIDAIAQHTNWTIRASRCRDRIPRFTTRLKTTPNTDLCSKTRFGSIYELLFLY
jgi:hypothetical protein